MARNASEDAVILLVGAKSDLAAPQLRPRRKEMNMEWETPTRAVTTEEAQKYAHRHGVLFAGW